MTRPTVHALVVPQPADRLRTWCGLGASNQGTTMDEIYANESIASSPEDVQCEECIAAMQRAVVELARAMPKLRSPGPRLVSVEVLASMLPGVAPSDDGLEVLAHAREGLRERERFARRLRVLEERQQRATEILGGRER